MLTDLLGWVLDAIQAIDPALRTVVAGLVMALETSALIGLVVPGDVVVLAAATGATSVGSAALLTAAVLTGALVGESIGFGLGRRFGPALQTSRLGRLLGDEHWERARRYVQRRGGPAVFLSRFIPVLHSTVPMIAGTSGFGYRAFLAWTAPACLLWSAAYVTAGSFAATVFRDLASGLKGAGLLLAGLVALVALAGLGVKTLLVRNERPYLEPGAADDDAAGLVAGAHRAH
ncbi:DedA family protein [Cellulomonas phragmiteti]|uniref:VTT domain-containing protein n=1 Tax=Cellulomonas phragmiteti TaxID=478780 RepID=A0ABQ4DJ11_9CELL|nr:DedA family protein [Cellulomonas phragmiteti]GIG39338.1 hypothetical protein Cph01nite_11000 [Cellulomonas phragmiteti]